MDSFRLDRTAVKIIKKGSEAPASDYWRTQSYEARISAIEFLRKQYDGTQSRLQRVYRIIKQ
jgi:hypothetical protein